MSDTRSPTQDASPWHENRRQERIESVRKVLRVKHQRGLKTVSIERFEDAVALVNELVEQNDRLRGYVAAVSSGMPREDLLEIEREFAR